MVEGEYTEVKSENFTDLGYIYEHPFIYLASSSSRKCGIIGVVVKNKLYCKSVGYLVQSELIKQGKALPANPFHIELMKNAT
jgi:hypothetical protein